MSNHENHPLLFLGSQDQETLMPESAELLELTKEGLLLAADTDTVILPTTGLRTCPDGTGSLYSVRAACPSVGYALVKTVGAYPANRQMGLPPDLGIASLHRGDTGQPVALFDAAPLTRWRTAAQVASAVISCARREARALCVIGARGIAPLAARMICEVLPFPDVRFVARGVETAKAAAAKHDRIFPGTARPATSLEEAVRGADVVLDGAGLGAHTPFFPVREISEGATIVSYGAFSSLPPDILNWVDGLLVDRWIDGDTGQTGAIGPAITAGRAERQNVRELLPKIVLKPFEGRLHEHERLLIVLRGLATCDIMLALKLHETAKRRSLGTPLSSA